ncbi:Guanylate cyclase soluble subunit beta-2,Soluble guanylate cyclase gcy-31,Retinal guanylyl cyclase 1,Soluble guanylate cyclase gcy-35,Receptor-type guanylate cyclase gcy-28,Retinal guanylyl cyclase 2,Soluble guanylate cyclase 89Db,Heat-stable enterotoxin receptor,Soluble guanylate cyclase 88E,Guanylate cyclase soluble subunit alpha-2 [Mytilus coruscus]|uniref:Guanylate cyclase n=1 Tax=Mytilus coruscus TaxID=42192 RepID=A0A6J8BVE7_MYTCO|nr:Guanylate cyclase soluble subunit beta-2,Soluble guanylate cyclase gcy-31,Retinal guanylyl cyclase 1,Soluble guanylate cyclase gcy-35,Receptor-type guanylate cyclase gcy-28,Retinal guanylyl cyclase 2,Soluble guanylate cyclase 89Db,Heat-stable enterotoxin receptor,Soluble guanylate cyclase 88E,Guanylate cyclase soluble subunit alpha-2 [Mytilus coruscus]
MNAINYYYMSKTDKQHHGHERKNGQPIQSSKHSVPNSELSLAVDDVKKEGLLPNHNLTIQYEDTQCNDVYGLGRTSDLLAQTRYHVIIGPQCSGTLTRFLGTFDKVGLAVTGLMDAFGWKRFSVISQYHVDKIWMLTRDAIDEIATKKNMTIAAVHTYGAEGEKSLPEIVENVAAESRSKFDCSKYHVDNNSDDNIAKEAYRNVIFVSYYTPRTYEYAQFIEKVKQRSHDIFNYTYAVDEEVPYPAANLYEAMYGFVLSLNLSLSNNTDIHDGETIAHRLWGNQYQTVTGNISLNSNGDRQQGYKFEQIGDDDNFTLTVVGYYFSANGKFTENDEDPIKWIGSDPPKDHPYCGFNGEYCAEGISQQSIIQIITGCFIAVVLLIICLSIIIQKVVARKIKTKESESIWRIKRSELSITERSMWSMSRVSIRSDHSEETVDNRMTKTAYYKGSLVSIRSYTKIQSDKMPNLKELRQMRELDHNNIVKTVGFVIDPPELLYVTEFCSKGSLMDILENEDINLDWDFKYCLMWDILEGLEYLSRSCLRYHGNLKSSNCLVDGRFVLKLGDYGPREWLKYKDLSDRDRLWSAPEIIKGFHLITQAANQTADIYSVGIIFHEILHRNGPFGVECLDMSTYEIVDKVKFDTIPPFRPVFDPSLCPQKLQTIIASCWVSNPFERPLLKDVSKTINSITGSKLKAKNLLDNLLKRMELYANNLEGIVEERTTKYLHEKQRAENLLYRLLPQSIAHQIQVQGTADPESFDNVTILFTDIVQFTTLSAESSPMQIIDMLNSLYSGFDEIINEYDVYKVETIGDAYMCVSGLPQRNTYHYFEVSKMIMSIMRYVSTYEIKHKPGRKLQMRAGVHSGSCVAGVIGAKMPRYCLFGDTVNTAARMESSGEASKVQISGATAALLKTDPSYTVLPRGEILVKGKGIMMTYWLEWETSV